MKKFAVGAAIFLVGMTLNLDLYAQSSDPRTKQNATEKPATDQGIFFKDLSAQRQQEILAHPEEYKLLPDGTVEVNPMAYISIPSGAVIQGDGKPTSSLGSPLQLTVRGLNATEGATIVNLLITSDGVTDEYGSVLAVIPGNSLAKSVERLHTLQQSKGIASYDIDPTYTRVSVSVAGLTKESFNSELQRILEARK